MPKKSVIKLDVAYFPDVGPGANVRVSLTGTIRAVAKDTVSLEVSSVDSVEPVEGTTPEPKEDTLAPMGKVMETLGAAPAATPPTTGEEETGATV